ncbi:MAG: hypothetical protein HQL32_18265, partial [Planctomycetes bacterium]|nr:hypothetical protein [Planctomycetota bacterium]
MPISQFDFFQLLSTLVKNEVDFIVVGGVGAVLQGAPLSTFDLDIVHSQESQNLKRLKVALDELNSSLREHKNRTIKPTLKHLASKGHLLLNSDAGPIDILAWIGDNKRYDCLLPHTVILKLDDEMAIKVLNLATIIETKISADRPKDKLHIS